MSYPDAEYCEVCDEEHEPSFFCRTCSDEGELVEVESPVLLYDGHGPDMETTEGWRYKHTCLNCCPGHRSGSEASAPPSIESKELVKDWDRPWEAGLACCGALASWHPAPMLYDEHNVHKLAGLVEAADVVISYNGVRFDIPFLEHFTGPLKIKRHVDMMQPIKAALGWRPKLEYVTRPTLGMGKGGHGSNAPDLWQQGLFAQLHNYCLRDVGIEYELYLHMERYGYVLVWDKDARCNRLVELSHVGRSPAKGRSLGFWDRAMGRVS